MDTFVDFFDEGARAGAGFYWLGFRVEGDCTTRTPVEYAAWSKGFDYGRGYAEYDYYNQIEVNARSVEGEQS